ncbi:hypothetical protein SGQ83_18355 [Flavobacterium sp. Fl-318]|uniref:PA14 domain-containing protein n=1 Tax=Flavobacterium cupriresistens TaxID=2893885 RepID=A0ABU4RHF3_9FLAO|nr:MULTISPECIES: hypothetical protein [unclassified Flavobacterium]MDX6191323.1 hypothetical protein [Flavobacterium sp. Fl-318]UFH42359.1 hypothetical protein LNP23_21450 [Flavobacterium sp. F-323]
MITQKKISKFKKTVAIYLAMMILLETFQPMQLYALTGGPSQPEFESFTPIGTSDMVDLSSGDFNYNIPIMDVGGYPLNLAYNSGVSMDQEASWVGLGWNLDVGQITRQLRGLPDDFDGDEMIYENNMKPNVTIGSNANVFLTAFGMKEDKKSIGAKIKGGMAVKYNNYDGITVTSSSGISFQVANNLSVGMDISSSASEGVSVSPSLSFNKKFKGKDDANNNMGASLGISYNNRKGLENMTLGVSAGRAFSKTMTDAKNNDIDINSDESRSNSGSVSFIDATFTPTKRVGMSSTNHMFSVNLEGEFWGIEGGMKFSGYRTSQGIKESEKYNIERAFGFENTYNAGKSDVLDFNREKDRTFNKNTRSLPVTNNTYDLYSIQGQGISGMYRPYKSQVGYVYDNEITDNSSGGSIGAEFGIGGGTHYGFDATVTLGDSRSAVWENSNPALNRFKEKRNNNRLDYEKVFFKNIGGNHVDQELNILTEKLGGYSPITLNIEGGKFSKRTSQNYYGKEHADGNKNPIEGTGSLLRKKRLSRNQAIQKLNRTEARSYGSDLLSPYSLKGKQDHHTSEIKITKDGGERYVYGRAVYNVVKKEVTFDVGKDSVDYKNGLVKYREGDNSVGNRREGDQYFNRVTTPSYAHSYLLTSVLSSDYQDIKDDGLTDDDLGTYTKFEYENKNADRAHTYKWRIPFKKNMANHDEGLRSSRKDNKGNYIYGEKELLYVKKITTKTHIALFHLSERNDGYGVVDENGSLGKDSKMYKLDKISLYSKPEYDSKIAKGEKPTPIKEAHFEYNYTLCQGVDNNKDKDEKNPLLTGQKGKLTLTKVYFTYKNSKMGKFTPYVFKYAPKALTENKDGSVNTDYKIEKDSINNPSYDMKGYDVWGNYRPSSPDLNGSTVGDLSNAEYPYIDQGDRAKADQYAAAWLLKSIRLPSGGQIEVNFESDDYACVQDKQAMEMFKVVGSGTQIPVNLNDLDNTIKERFLGEYIYVEIDKDMDNRTFRDTYLKSIGTKENPLYFRFLLNMVNPDPILGGNTDKYDYVTGYLRTNTDMDCGFFTTNGKKYASIPMLFVGQGDGFSKESDRDTNPIQKAGWNFGRQNLNRLVYNINNEEDTNDLKGIVMELIFSMSGFLDIFSGPNEKLKDTKIASKFIAGKSWIRLMNTNSHKIGGGSRVKNIELHDQWNVMTGNSNDPLYHQSYGQVYTYTDKNGNSSGVATYEPLGSKENPFVKPLYDRNKRDLLLGPESDNYVEEPLGESFFPSPKVTYSRVTVANLPREKMINNQMMVVKKHATGSVVTEFYTSKEFPTIVDRTTLSSNFDSSTALAGILNLKVRNHIGLAQGFSIHTNDMDGKMKKQQVFGEGQETVISEVEYKYNLEANPANVENGRLNNIVETIDSEGTIAKKLVGVDYDVINDFRESTTRSTTGGINFNVAQLPFTIVLIIVPTLVFSYSEHEDQIRMATTTKVIHSSGILVEKVASDLGSKVTTKNLAWDADTGEVLLTQTTNEYTDNYFSFNFPAYWSYKGMSQAAKNVDFTSKIEKFNSGYKLEGTARASDYLINGDEVFITGFDADDNRIRTKAWIVKVNDENFKILDIDGKLIQNVDKSGKIKVIRSGYRNMQMATMAGITSMRNPLYNYDSNNKIVSIKPKIEENPFQSDDASYRIVNASAVSYNDIWPSQCECNLPKMVFDKKGDLEFAYEKTIVSDDDADSANFYNPYVFNVLGNWRANKSYAFLTGRNYTKDPTPRKTGFFADFYPLYVMNQGKWGISSHNLEKWTYASEVTQYNPYGQEVENKDALSRYSSALYGYNNRLPVAVASNTAYSELASDGFEDYDSSPECARASHFDYKAQLKQNDISVTTAQSHTGRKSLRVAPSRKALVKKQVIPCLPSGTR